MSLIDVGAGLRGSEFDHTGEGKSGQCITRRPRVWLVYLCTPSENIFTCTNNAL